MHEASSADGFERIRKHDAARPAAGVAVFDRAHVASDDDRMDARRQRPAADAHDRRRSDAVGNVDRSRIVCGRDEHGAVVVEVEHGLVDDAIGG